MNLMIKTLAILCLIQLCRLQSTCGPSTNCVTCTNSTYCSSCMSNYTLTNGTCILCNSTGCITCQSSNNCTSCISGYQLNLQSNLCISCNIQNCSTCSNNNNCNQCISGLNPTSNSDQCTTCNVTNCLSCSSINQCGVCNNGFQVASVYLNESLNAVCVTCSVSNCQICSNNNYCKVCSQGYSELYGIHSCIQCNFPCNGCNQNGTCISCVTPLYFSSALLNGTCIPNNILNCVKYSFTNTSQCSQCLAGYTLSGNKCTYTCNINCLLCYATDTNQCISCMIGYYLNNNSICIQCQSNCAQCNSTMCSSCNGGFYLINGLCLTCPGYCSYCLNPAICYQLQNPQQQTIVMINSQAYLALCPLTCSSCSTVNPSICLSCMTGFYLSANMCYACSGSCKICDSNQCYSCYPNQFLVNNTCISCSNNCLSCLNSTALSTCLTCYQGYYLNNGLCTSNCSTNCLSCSSPNICIQCSLDYTLYQQNATTTLCVQCPTNCPVCAINSPTICLSCSSGFYLSGNTCIACSSFCSQCNQVGCLDCINGYFLASSLTCSPNCILPCATCSSTNPTVCTSCIAGYTFNSLSSTCTPQINCNGACSVCPLGYINQNGQCIQCNLINCQTCSNSNLSQCLSCNPSYYLNSNTGQCSTCLPSCATCLTGNGCITCATGYTTVNTVTLTSSGYQCFQCVSPCQTCLGQTNQCTSCISGYSMIGWKCIQNFYFAFNIILSTNLNNFNQNYMSFIQNLASTVGSSDQSIVSITNIIFNYNLNVQGIVAPTASSGSALAATQFSNLQSMLTQYSINGMQILNTSITVVGGTTNAPLPSFQCQVSNCSNCSYPNSCGQCMNNYLLTLNIITGQFYCNPITCPSNCMTCYQNNICQNCSAGYFITNTGQCSMNSTSSAKLSPYCLWGLNNTNCQLCSYGYTLLNGYCYQTITVTSNDPNCLVKMTSAICQICQNGYIVNIYGKCINSQYNITTIPFCLVYSNYSCQFCAGYPINNNGTCGNVSNNVTNCAVYSNNTQCSACQTGYILMQNNTCLPVGYGCNVQYCQMCIGPQNCSVCQVGYQLFAFNISSGYLYLCKKLPCPYNINNCNACAYNYNSIFQYGQILCDINSCAIGYINVYGYCVANITNTSISCNQSMVPNCLSCSYPNFCSQCQAGYSLTRQGQCQINQCNIPYCISCGLNGICQQCAFNYQLNSGFLSIFKPSNAINFTLYLLNQCTYNSGITCNISNCSYCLTNNVCAVCMSGYSININNNCINTCNVSNCYQCSPFSNTICTVCQLGYLLNSIGTQCNILNYTCIIGCMNNSCIYNWNTNRGQCSMCNSSMILYNGLCYSPNCTIYGCSLCFPSINPICIQCQQSLILQNGYCIIPNCHNNVLNCINCIQNNTCIGCRQGYYLQNTINGTVCVNASSIINCYVQNCVQCSSNNSNVCITCASPYVIMNGQCVCQFQNCLDCSTSIYSCNLCPFPLINTQYQAKCIPSPSLNQICNVANCQQCLSSNQCSICSPGYSLNSINYSCSLNNCSALGLANCQLCDQFGYECFMCIQGYMIDNFLQGGKCYQFDPSTPCQVQGCASCQFGSSNVCLSCLPTYYSNGTGLCVPYNCNISNCYLCFTNNTCSICDTGYYLSINLICIAKYNNIVNCGNQIQYCQICVNGLYMPSVTPFCIKCQNGFQFNTLTSTCVAQKYTIPNCKIQTFDYNNQNLPICTQCQQGYFINSFQQCSILSPQIVNTGCPIYGCLFCAMNSSFCSNCFSPWNLSSTTGICQTQSPNICVNMPFCSTCVNSTYCAVCIDNDYISYQGVCIYCTVPQCIQCQTTFICSLCASGYQLNVNNNTCTVNLQCNITNCINCLTNTTCATCSNNLTPNTIGNQCVSCNVLNCISCVSNNTCGQCIQGYSLNQGACVNCNVSFCQYCFTTNNCSNCSQGYNLNNNSCISCNIVNCINCVINNVCSQCMSNLQPSTGGYQCVVCNVTNCISCSANYTCGQCMTNYTLSQNGSSCILCNITNCLTCMSINQCSSCQQGYQLNVNNNVCILCNISSCLTCLSNNFCAQCIIEGQMPSVNGDQCVICNINNCMSCNNDGTCAVCENGYQLNTNRFYQSINQCVQCNVYNCQSCQDNNICQYCVYGYYVLNGTCLVCNFPCDRCNSDGTCQTCQTQYYAMNPINGTCKLQTIPNCIQYQTNNITNCLQCSDPYVLNTTTNTCELLCLDGCQFCNQQSLNSCSYCQAGYYLTINNTCLQCQSLSCLSCNATACTGCFAGFYLSTQTNSCIPCPSYCYQCINATYCNLNGSPGQVLITINSQTFLALCAQTCLTCSYVYPSICLSCRSGYYLNNGICYPCDSNCMTCNPINTNQCFSCYRNNFLINNTCVTCMNNCLTCLTQDPEYCLSCYSGYYLQNNSCVQGCSLNCISCSSSTICTICSSGYTLFTNSTQVVCAPCISNCQSCAVNMPTLCLQYGYTYSLSGGTSTTCTPFCDVCNQQTCIYCKFGYFLTSSLTCSVNCILPCATCSSTNPTVCTSCIAGYIFNSLSSTCTPQINCNGACIICPLGYILQNNQCIQCNLINCQTCLSSNLSQCLSCNPGYYLNSNTGQCNSCPSSCSTCYNNISCLTCATGYTNLIQFIQPGIYQCLPCNLPCFTCYSSQNYCTSCISGYNLIGIKCVSNFYFGFNLTLQTNSTIFNQLFLNFISVLINVIGSQNSNLLTIDNITYGSVIVQGQLAPAASGTQEVNNQFQIFQNSLSQNSSIAGMQISQSTVKIVGGTTNVIPNSTSNIGLILGICIPVGILIIAGVAFIIYRRKKKLKQNQLNISDDFRKSGKQQFELGNIEKQSENTKRIF